MNLPRPLLSWLPVVAVIAVVAGLYHRAPSLPYHWTDHAEIEGGALVPRDLPELVRFLTLPKGEARTIERQDYGPVGPPAGPPSATREAPRIGYFRPIKVLTYGLDWVVGGGEPWSFHLTNLLLHALFCVLALVLFRGLLGERFPGLVEVLALLHAMAPVHVEPVCWISARSDTLWGVFLLLSILATLRARTSGHPRVLRAVAAACVLFGVASKESGIATVPLLWIIAWSVPDPACPSPRNRLLREGLWPAVVVLLFVAYRFFAVGDVRLSGGGEGPHPGTWTLIHLFGMNLFQCLLPVGLKLADTIEIQSAPTLLGAAGLLVYFSWLFAGLRLRQRTPWILICALGWLLCILPVSQLIPVLQPRGERYLYVPSLFVELAVLQALWILSAPLRSVHTRRLLLALGGIALAALALLTYVRAELWRHEGFLFAYATHEEPHCAECWNNLAYTQIILGGNAHGADSCLRALSIDRTRYWTYLDGFSVRWLLVRALLDLGRGAEAGRWAEEILLKSGISPAGLALLARSHLQAGRFGEALELAEWGLRLDRTRQELEVLAAAATSALVATDTLGLEAPLTCREAPAWERGEGRVSGVH